MSSHSRWCADDEDTFRVTVGEETGSCCSVICISRPTTESGLMPLPAFASDKLQLNRLLRDNWKFTYRSAEKTGTKQHRQMMILKSKLSIEEYQSCFVVMESHGKIAESGHLLLYTGESGEEWAELGDLLQPLHNEMFRYIPKIIILQVHLPHIDESHANQLPRLPRLPNSLIGYTCIGGVDSKSFSDVGGKRHSVFINLLTSQLSTSVEEKDEVELEDVLRSVSRKLEEKTAGQQVFGYVSFLRKKVVFVKPQVRTLLFLSMQVDIQ